MAVGRRPRGPAERRAEVAARAARRAGARLRVAATVLGALAALTMLPGWLIEDVRLLPTAWTPSVAVARALGGILALCVPVAAFALLTRRKQPRQAGGGGAQCDSVAGADEFYDSSEEGAGMGPGRPDARSSAAAVEERKAIPSPAAARKGKKTVKPVPNKPATRLVSQRPALVEVIESQHPPQPPAQPEPEVQHEQPQRMEDERSQPSLLPEHPCVQLPPVEQLAAQPAEHTHERVVQPAEEMREQGLLSPQSEPAEQRRPQEAATPARVLAMPEPQNLSREPEPPGRAEVEAAAEHADRQQARPAEEHVQQHVQQQVTEPPVSVEPEPEQPPPPDQQPEDQCEPGHHLHQLRRGAQREQASQGRQEHTRQQQRRKQPQQPSQTQHQHPPPAALGEVPTSHEAGMRRSPLPQEPHSPSRIEQHERADEEQKPQEQMQPMQQEQQVQQQHVQQPQHMHQLLHMQQQQMQHMQQTLLEQQQILQQQLQQQKLPQEQQQFLLLQHQQYQQQQQQLQAQQQWQLQQQQAYLSMVHQQQTHRQPPADDRPQPQQRSRGRRSKNRGGTGEGALRRSAPEAGALCAPLFGTPAPEGSTPLPLAVETPAATGLSFPPPSPTVCAPNTGGAASSAVRSADMFATPPPSWQELGGTTVAAAGFAAAGIIAAPSFGSDCGFLSTQPPPPPPAVQVPSASADAAATATPRGARERRGYVGCSVGLRTPPGGSSTYVASTPTGGSPGSRSRSSNESFQGVAADFAAAVAAPALDAAVAAAMACADRCWAIDVECVATGVRHCDRAVAQVSLIRGDGFVELDLYVKPSEPTVSYLTPLTGLTAELLEEKGVALDAALATLRAHLPKDAIVVGHSVHHDIRWLGLQLGVDFAGVADVADLWRAWHPRYQSWSLFGQEHMAKVLLGEDMKGGSHNAVGDAVKSLKLLRLHQELTARGGDSIERAKQALLEAPLSLSFARRHPIFEGVCMGNRKTCTCGAPFNS